MINYLVKQSAEIALGIIILNVAISMIGYNFDLPTQIIFKQLIALIMASIPIGIAVGTGWYTIKHIFA